MEKLQPCGWTGTNPPDLERKLKGLKERDEQTGL